MNAMLVFVMAAQGIFPAFVNGWYYGSPQHSLKHVFFNVWHSTRVGTLLYVMFAEIVFWGVISGPTSFAPVIEMEITIVEQSGGQYHVLVIITDGQVTRSVDTSPGHLSPQEKDTMDAIVRASEYPLSIILVDVGDGPWDTMKEFDDNIPARAFDNFQCVNFTKIMLKSVPLSKKETEFALAALTKMPSQYKATIELKILGRRMGYSLERVSLPPHLIDGVPSSFSSFKPSQPTYCPSYDTPVGSSPPVSSVRNNQEENVEIMILEGKDALTISLYQMDLDRTLFRLRSYLRIRLQKQWLEIFCQYLYRPLLQNQPSAQVVG